MGSFYRLAHLGFGHTGFVVANTLGATVWRRPSLYCVPTETERTLFPFSSNLHPFGRKTLPSRSMSVAAMALRMAARSVDPAFSSARIRRAAALAVATLERSASSWCAAL